MPFKGRDTPRLGFERGVTRHGFVFKGVGKRHGLVFKGARNATAWFPKFAFRAAWGTPVNRAWGEKEMREEADEDFGGEGSRKLEKI